MKVTDDIKYVGVNDHQIDLFESQYPVKNGMCYNSYVILDDKITVMDTVDKNFGNEWLSKVETVLDGKKPDYLVCQHMEPDHSANMEMFLEKYPNCTVVASAKAFQMMKGFYGNEYENRRIIVKDGDSLITGHHKLTFIAAPMVHWPEVIMTYDAYDKAIFTADAFGKFGALDHDEEWIDEARRYYIGIVGKYGVQVQNLLKKVLNLDLKLILPLHGPILNENLSYYLNLYDTWSSYKVEKEGVVIACSSIYGNTYKVCALLKEMLEEKGIEVKLYDLARSDISLVTSEAFKYSKLVLASATYNADIFPDMKNFINHLIERNYKGRKVALIENGSWAPMANKVMKSMLEGLKDLEFTNEAISIKSSLDANTKEKLVNLVNELM